MGKFCGRGLSKQSNSSTVVCFFHVVFIVEVLTSMRSENLNFPDFLRDGP